MSNKENNTKDGFGKGITLIIIGVLALLVTFFEFEIDWWVLAKMWPLLLIIIGVCIMPINRWIKTAVAVVLLVVGYYAYQGKISVVESVEKTEMESTFKGDF